MNLGFNFKKIGCIVDLGVRVFHSIPSLLAVVKNIKFSLISDCIMSYSHDMIKESSTSQASNFGPSLLGTGPVKWLSFPLPFNFVRTTLDQIRSFFPSRTGWVNNLNFIEWCLSRLIDILGWIWDFGGNRHFDFIFDFIFG